MTAAALSDGVAILAFLYLAAISLVLWVVDVRRHRLPNVIVLPSYLVGAVLLFVASSVGGDLPALARAGAGCLILGGFYLLLALASPRGMGFGDVKLAGLLGQFLGWLGWGPLVVCAVVPFVAGGVFGLVLIAVRRGRAGASIAFGPWMLAGAWLGVVVSFLPAEELLDLV